MKGRILEKENRFFPQRYSNGFFGLFKGWRYFESDELWLNGIFTTIDKGNLSFPYIEQAKDFLDGFNQQKEIIHENSK